jgi:prephenate dehydrogenase
MSPSTFNHWSSVMKIGIIGSGNMGRSLGILWAEQQHQVFFGARTAEQGQAVAALAGQGTQGGTNDAAAVFAFRREAPRCTCIQVSVGMKGA